MKFSILLLLIFSMVVSGCRTIGPSSVANDRYDYSGAVSESWKRQTLLNIVKLRYCDTPIYVDVGQIVAGYQMEYTAGIGSELHWRSSVDTFVGPQVGAHYVDRPTITYTPMTGAKFMAGIVTPVSPTAIFATIQSGWPADAMLRLCTNSINGLRNESLVIDNYNAPDPRFLRATKLIRELQQAGVVNIRIPKSSDSTQSSSLALRLHHATEENLAQLSELREMLKLNPTATEFKLVYGIHPADDAEIALQTRSLLNVTNALALHVNIPHEEIDAGRATSGIPDITSGLVQFHCGDEKPTDAFVAVQYRNHWFWVEDTDLRTKQVFSFLMLLFTMSNTTGDAQNPVLTISTN